MSWALRQGDCSAFSGWHRRRGAKDEPQGDAALAADHRLHRHGLGEVKDGRIVKVAGLKSPFDVAIDAQNRVWVSNSQSDTVVPVSCR
jgi:hypothetical protein